MRREVLGEGQAPAAARDDQAQLAVDVAELLEQGVDLALELGAGHLELDRGRRALQAVEVLAEREGPPSI